MATDAIELLQVDGGVGGGAGNVVPRHLNADLKYKPTYEEFRQSFLNGMVNPEGMGLGVGEAEIHGDEAVVNVTIYYSYSDPFSTRTGYTESALLVEQDGAWKVSSMPGNFWDWNWYQEPYKP